MTEDLLPHLVGKDVARISTDKYTIAQNLISQLDQLLHDGLDQNHARDSVSDILDDAHGLIHDIAHALVDLDSPDYEALHPETQKRRT